MGLRTTEARARSQYRDRPMRQQGDGFALMGEFTLLVASPDLELDEIIILLDPSCR
jgi:hypothetical protein